MRDLNRVYRERRRCGSATSSPTGFRWLEANDAANNVFAFARLGEGTRRRSSACSISRRCRATTTASGCPVLPLAEALNTDSAFYGGSGVGNLGAVEAEPMPWNDQPFSALVTLPPLGAVWLVPE